MTDLGAAIALASGAGAVIVWAIALIATLRRPDRRQVSERVIASIAFLASLGAAASAIGFAQRQQLLPTWIDPSWLTFVASFGRGALLAAGLLWLAEHGRPHR